MTDDVTHKPRRRVAMDLGPLRDSRDFRLVLGSGTVSMLGSFVTMVAIPFQIKELTDSYIAVGIVGIIELAPLIFFGLWGGAIADAWDRRRVILFCESAFLLVSAVLLVNALNPTPRLWPIYVAAAASAAIDSLQRPSLDALIARVVRPDQMAAAGALSGLRWQTGSLLGPSLGGLLVAFGGPGLAYGFDAATFVVSVLLLLRLAPNRAASGAERPSLSTIRAGLGYAWSRKDLLGTYLADISAMVFAFSFALFPFIADQYHAPWALGLLYSAPFVGSLVATLTSGWTGRIHSHGRLVVLAGLVWGGATAMCAVVPNIWWLLFWLAVAGGADMVSGLFRGLIWNLSVPNELRGRMAGVELLSYSVGPQLGNLRSAGTAALIGVRGSLAVGGVLCMMASGALAQALPTLWSYDDRSNPDAVRERALRDAAAS